ncbi:hypothetical protein B0H19DRAFT_1062371 [Mycena capillaripes]|nr:hypothetical protein B0H19DRAFT_1062371 [Mycena capillaripes]
MLTLLGRRFFTTWGVAKDWELEKVRVLDAAGARSKVGAGLLKEWDGTKMSSLGPWRWYNEIWSEYRVRAATEFKVSTHQLTCASVVNMQKIHGLAFSLLLHLVPRILWEYSADNKKPEAVVGGAILTNTVEAGGGMTTPGGGEEVVVGGAMNTEVAGAEGA